MNKLITLTLLILTMSCLAGESNTSHCWNEKNDQGIWQVKCSNDENDLGYLSGEDSEISQIMNEVTGK